MATIGSLAVNIVARTEGFTKGVMKAQKGLAAFGSKIGAITVQLLKYSAAATAAGAAATAWLVRGQMSAVDALAKTSDKLGIATEKLAGLRLAAQETGVSTETLDMAMQRMVRRIAEAAQGTGEAKGAIKELGLDAKALARLSPDKQFREIAGAMSQVGTQGDKVRLAMKLFDSEGVALVNTLKLGTVGLDDAQAAAERLGLTVSREMAAGVERANDAIGRLFKAVQGFGRQLAVRLAPLMEKAAKWFENLLTDDGRIHKWANMVAAAIGGAIAAIIKGVHQLRIAFADVRQGVFDLMLDMKKSNILKMVEAVTGVAVDLPGISARDLGKKSQQAWYEGQQLRGQDPAGDFLAWFNKHLDNAFNTTTPESKKSQSIINEWASKLSTQGLEGIGSFLARGSGFAVGAKDQLVKGAVSMMNGEKAGPTPGFSLVQSGSAESYRQRRRIEKNNDPMMKVAQENARDNKRAADGIWKLAENWGLVPANF